MKYDIALSISWETNPWKHGNIFGFVNELVRTRTILKLNKLGSHKVIKYKEPSIQSPKLLC